MARPFASTWGSTTVSRVGAVLAARAALPWSLALSAAAAPKLPPPLGSLGSPGKPGSQIQPSLQRAADFPVLKQVICSAEDARPNVLQVSYWLCKLDGMRSGY